MQILRDYIDESYNNRTFCIGGWLASDYRWSQIQASWQERIDYENRISAKKGFPPISRYHAADCSNLKKDFGENKGWDVRRQIRLTKRFCEIIAEHSPIGSVIGGGVEHFKKYLPMDAEDFKRGLYRISFKMHLVEVSHVMREWFPDDKVKVYCERSGEFESVSRTAFEEFISDPAAVHMSKYFVDMETEGWETCIPLQPADFIAYEGMKRLDQFLKGSDAVRKSLQALVGADVPIVTRGYVPETYEALLQIANNKDEGKPLADGVTGNFAEVL